MPIAGALKKVKRELLRNILQQGINEELHRGGPEVEGSVGEESSSVCGGPRGGKLILGSCYILPRYLGGKPVVKLGFSFSRKRRKDGKQ